MSIKPPISIPFQYGGYSATAFLTSGVWSGFPYRFQIEATIIPQPHSDDSSPSPYQYNGEDVKVGDWLLTDLGTAVQIVSIVTANTSALFLDCEVEDIGLYNVYRDPTVNGEALPINAQGVIFRLDDEGMPVVDPAYTPFITPFLYTNIIARFQYTTSAQVVSGVEAKNWLHANFGSDFTIAASADAINAVALGQAAKSVSTNSIAIGTSALVSGTNSIVLGTNIQLDQNNSIAMGNNGVTKLMIDQNSNASFGRTDPNTTLNIHRGSTDNYFSITNSLTGTSADRGIIIGIPSSSTDLKISNRENANITVENAGFERINIDTSGYINFRYGNFGTNGDAEHKTIILKGVTSANGVQQWLTTATGAEMHMSENTAWMFEVDLLGKEQSGTDAAGYKFRGMALRTSAVSTIQFVEIPTEEIIAESVSAFAWEGGVSADTSTGNLRVYALVSSYDGSPVNWIAYIKITEVNF